MIGLECRVLECRVFEFGCLGFEPRGRCAILRILVLKTKDYAGV